MPLVAKRGRSLSRKGHCFVLMSLFPSSTLDGQTRSPAEDRLFHALGQKPTRSQGERIKEDEIHAKCQPAILCADAFVDKLAKRLPVRKDMKQTMDEIDGVTVHAAPIDEAKHGPATGKELPKSGDWAAAATSVP